MAITKKPVKKTKSVSVKEVIVKTAKKKQQTVLPKKSIKIAAPKFRPARGTTNEDALTKIVTGMQKSVGNFKGRLKDIENRLTEAERTNRELKDENESLKNNYEHTNQRVTELTAKIHKASTEGEY